MKLLLATAFAAGLVAAGAAQATTYTQDGNLADFTNGVTDYATFSNFHDGDAPGGNPYTPTTATLNHDYRVFNWTGDPVEGLAPGNWVLATFTDPESVIRVFPNIDHEHDSYDGYQYSIYGSNNGTVWNPLFDAVTVNGSLNLFTLGSYSGTAPTRVNNVLTPGFYNDAGGGTVGYIADFSFNKGYKYFAFGTSTMAGPWNPEQEFSAVAAIPEPAAWALMIVGFGGAGMALRRRRRSALTA